jgi:hypothetical protein
MKILKVKDTGALTGNRRLSSAPCPLSSDVEIMR